MRIFFERFFFTCSKLSSAFRRKTRSAVWKFWSFRNSKVVKSDCFALPGILFCLKYVFRKLMSFGARS